MIRFSEKLRSIDDLSKQGMNLTVFNLLKSQIMNVTYICRVQTEGINPIIPSLAHW
jgi:hypothetical protein